MKTCGSCSWFKIGRLASDPHTSWGECFAPCPRWVHVAYENLNRFMYPTDMMAEDCKLFVELLG